MPDLNINLTLRDRVSRNLKGVKKSFQGLRDTAGKIGRNWANIHFAVQDVLQTAKKLGEVMHTLGIEANAQMERYRVQLKSALGTWEKADKMLTHMKEFTAETPFNVGAVVEAGIALENVGLSAREHLETVGNVAGAFGRNINETANAVMSMEAEVLRRLGVNVRREADKATFTWRDQWGEMRQLTKEGSFRVQQQTLLAIWNKRYKGGMDDFAKTYKGMLSNLQDAWFLFRAEIGEAGFFDEIKEQMRATLDVIEEMRESGQLEQLAKNLSGAMSTMLTVGKAVLKTLVQVGSGVAMAVNVVQGFFSEIGQFFTGIIDKILWAVQKVNESIADMVAKIPGIGDDLAIAFNKAALGIQHTRDDLAGIDADFDQFAKDRQKDIEGITDTMNGIIEMLKGEVTPAVKEQITEQAQAIKDKMGEAADSTKESFKEMGEHLHDVAKKTAKAMESAFSNIFFDAMTGQLKSFQDYAVSVGRSILRAITDAMAQALVAQLGIANIFSAGGGGLLGGLLSFQHGTPYVPSDGMYMLHQGERVVPRHENDGEGGSGAGGATININQVIKAWDAEDVWRNRKTLSQGLIEDLRRNAGFRTSLKKYK